MKGGFPAVTASTPAGSKDKSGYNPKANVTTIKMSSLFLIMSENCTLQGLVINGNNTGFSINDVYHTWPSTTYNLIDMDISNFTGPSIFVDGPGTINATNCYFHNNQATNGGGAITTTTAGDNTITIKNCSFYQNQCIKPDGGSNGTAEDVGGAITACSSNLTIDDSYFCENSTLYGGGGAIGSLYNGIGHSRTVIIRNSVFTNNQCRLGGGAIGLTADNLTLTNTHFYGNKSGLLNTITTKAYGGGALEMRSTGGSTLTGCNFYGNQSTNPVAPANFGTNGGGAIGIFGGNHTLTNCKFDQNTSVQPGGAIYFNNYGNSSLNLNTCIFKNNKYNNNSSVAGSDVSLYDYPINPLGKINVKSNSYMQLSGSSAYRAVYSNAASANYVFDASTVWGNTGTGLTVTTTPCPTSINPVVATIQGLIWNDADGSLSLNGSEAGTNAGGLYVNLVNATNALVSSTSVAANGSFSLTAPTSTTGLKLVLTTSSTATTPGPLPTGWVNTGDVAGSNNSATQSATLGQIELSTGTTDPSGQSFGIEQRPTTGSGTATLSNSGGTNPVTIPPSAFTSTSPSTDTAPGSVTAIRITSFPTNTTSLTINGTVYTASSPEFTGGTPTGVVVPTDGNGAPAVPILLDPTNDSNPVSFSYVAVDNAGKEATNTGTATLNFTVAVPDLSPVIYARPSTVYSTTAISVVVDVYELNAVATNGLITLKLNKDPKVSLSFTGGATSVGGRLVQNGIWNFDGSSDPDYYILTTSSVIPAGGVRSFGLSGSLSPGSTSGTLTFSVVIGPGSGGEVFISNNTDADKIDFFQQ